MHTMKTGLIALNAVTATFGADSIELAADHETVYRIVVADEPSVEVIAVAGELARFLKQVTDAEFLVVKGSSTRCDRQIIDSRSKALNDLNLSVD